MKKLKTIIAKTIVTITMVTGGGFILIAPWFEGLDVVLFMYSLTGLGIALVWAVIYLSKN